MDETTDHFSKYGRVRLSCAASECLAIGDKWMTCHLSAVEPMVLRKSICTVVVKPLPAVSACPVCLHFSTSTRMSSISYRPSAPIYATRTALLCVSQLVRLTKLAIPAQQKRISAQQATGIQQAPGGGFRLAGEETVLIPAPGAYPTSLSVESSECLHQGLRVVYVLAQYMPKYLEVGCQ